MNGIGEIIFLVLVLGILGVRQFLKKNKQKEEREQPVKTEKGSGETPQEAWRSLFGGDDPFDFGSKTEPIPQRAAQTASNTSSSNKNEYSNQDARFKGRFSKNIHEKPSEAGIGAAPVLEEAEDDGLIKDFDIRKAIIYTEIMTPKFKE